MDGNKYNQGSTAAVAPRPADPDFVIKYRVRELGGQKLLNETEEQQIHGGQEEAHGFIRSLVEQGRALPGDIALYRNEGIGVRVEVTQPPRAVR